MEPVGKIHSSPRRTHFFYMIHDLMVTQKQVRAVRSNICYLICLKAFDQIESSPSLKRHIFLHACATCSDLAFDQSTMDYLYQYNPFYFIFQCYINIFSLYSAQRSSRERFKLSEIKEEVIFYMKYLFVLFFLLICKFLVQEYPADTLCSPNLDNLYNYRDINTQRCEANSV